MRCTKGQLPLQKSLNVRLDMFVITESFEELYWEILEVASGNVLLL